MELTEPTRYFSLFEALAGGNTDRNELTGTTVIDYNQLSKYRNRLSRLRLVAQHVFCTLRFSVSSFSSNDVSDSRPVSVTAILTEIREQLIRMDRLFC